MHIDLLRLVLLSTLQWLASAIKQSIAEHLRARWAWGAYFGIETTEFYERLGVQDARTLLLRANDRHYSTDPGLQMILHPERSRIARAFTGATMTKYGGGTLPLPPIEEEDEVLSDSVDHLLDAMNLGF